MTVHSDQGLLYSTVLKLAPQRQGRIRATHGHHAHAAFLQAVRRADPALAEVLHHPQLPLRPFTVSPLLGVGPGHEGEVYVSPERDYFLRFTVLYEPIFEQFMGRFLRPALSTAEGGGGRPQLYLGRTPFLIKEILTTPGSHPWAGYCSWVELVQGAAPVEGATLQFTTPTAFSFGKRDWGQQVVPLPVPRLVFGSLARTWNALAPPALHLDRQALRAYVEDNVVVAGMRGVRTRMLAFRDAPQLGFVGRVSFEFKGRDERMRCQLEALAELAFYAGVGYKTTMGMGQCRRVDEGRRTKDEGPLRETKDG